ncbi:hypothetical protein AB2B38_008975 [Balneola sp. MJW-20]
MISQSTEGRILRKAQKTEAAPVSGHRSPVLQIRPHPFESQIIAGSEKSY